VRKRKIKAITPFKFIRGEVIEVGIDRKPVRLLIVINSNGHPISCSFGVISAYCSNFGHFAFLSHPLGGLETTYDVHLGLIGKRKSVSVNLTFIARSYTAEALRTKIGRKSAISLQRGHFDPKFQVEGDVPHQSCMDS